MLDHQQRANRDRANPDRAGLECVDSKGRVGGPRTIWSPRSLLLPACLVLAALGAWRPAPSAIAQDDRIAEVGGQDLDTPVDAADAAGSTSQDSAGASAEPDARPDQARSRLYLPFALDRSALRAAPPVVFSPARGSYESPFELKLFTQIKGTRIRYTLDGSLPSEANGLDYAGAIPIERSTVVRAMAFQDQAEPSAVATNTYLFVADAATQNHDVIVARGYPSYWGRYTPDSRFNGWLIPADYGLRPDVLPDYQAALPAALRSLPSMVLAMAPADFFDEARGIYTNPLSRGDAWERPVSAELIFPDRREGFQIDAGVRIAGGWSRMPDSTPKHSFNLDFKSKYGPSSLHYPLFPDASVTQFKSLRLRGGQADSFPFFSYKAQYVHDQWARDTQRDMGGPSAHGRFVHLYLNGIYWGVYNVAEEISAAFAASYLGGDKDDWDVVKDGDLVDGKWTVDVEDGDREAFDQMLGVPAAHPEPDPTDRSAYEALAKVLDVRQHIDYLLIQIYAANFDWPLKNWQAIHNRATGDRFQYLVWDLEHSTGLRDSGQLCISRADPLTGLCGFMADTPGPQDLHRWLLHFPEYRMQFADRAQRHLFVGAGYEAEMSSGALTAEQALRRYKVRADQVHQAIVAESARWGTERPTARTNQDNFYIWRNYRPLYPGARSQTQAMWLDERRRLETEYFPARTDIVLQQLCDQGLYPSITAPHAWATGGDPRQPSWLTLEPGASGCKGALPDEQIFFTTDGLDPRQAWTGSTAIPWSGDVSPSAKTYRSPLKLAGFTLVRARAAARRDGRWVWSALTEASFGVPRVAISEIMYHPVEGDATEYLELENREELGVDISGWQVSQAVTFTLPEGTRLGPRQHLVLVRDAAAFGQKYPTVAVAGVFQGKLDNDGERIVLEDADGQRVVDFTYRPDGLWPRSPDGWGYALVPLTEAGDPEDPEAWRASADAGGSPGVADPPVLPTPVAINEVLANAAEPLEDAIELFNPGRLPVDVGGWFLSDDPADPKRFRIPTGTLVSPGGFRVFYQMDFGNGPKAFDLSPAGGTALLSSADAEERLTGFMRGFEFGATDPGQSVGRYKTSQGVDVPILANRTFGADEPATLTGFRRGAGLPNAGPLVGPVVLNELMVNPAAGGDEFVELHNVTEMPVSLYDAADPTAVWSLSEGVTFNFPQGVVLPAGGLALVVPTQPEAFRVKFGVPSEVPIFGPYSGKLANEGERVTLTRPGPLDASGGRARIVVDALRYGIDAPWPALAAGRGPSLERVQPDAYGNDPVNWLAIKPGGTPGRANSRVTKAWLPRLYAAGGEGR